MSLSTCAKACLAVNALRRPAFLMAVILVACSGMSAAQAQLNLAYSFETGLEGFAPNPSSLNITVTQDATGATDGANSMKLELTAGATFEGALGDSPPAVIDNPPGVEIVRFDLTLTEAFAGVFVQGGITVFGQTQDGSQQGLEIQFNANEVPLGDLGSGTHEIEIELAEAIHPTQGIFGAFNDIFGDDPTDIIPTGFQIYINKSADAAWIGYVDNIRVGVAPAEPDADFDNDGDVDGIDLGIWKGAFGPSALGDADGDLDSDGQDFLLWQRQLSGSGISAVPEPVALGLASIALLAGWVKLRRMI
jgi:hypothetical protein